MKIESCLHRKRHNSKTREHEYNINVTYIMFPKSVLLFSFSRISAVTKISFSAKEISKILSFFMFFFFNSGDRHQVGMQADNHKKRKENTSKKPERMRDEIIFMTATKSSSGA